MFLNIPIADDVNCLLKTGQTVDFNSPFLEKKSTTDLSVEVAMKLRIPSHKIFNYLNKFVGDTVKKGDILAKKKALLNNAVVVSESEGVIKEINHLDGKIIISAENSKINRINAFFKGEVVELKKNNLKLKVGQLHEFNLKIASDYFGGEAFYLKDSSNPMFATQTSNKIMIIESVASYIITKAEALGIKGFITLKNPPQDSILPKGQIKNIDDFNKILHLKLPNCFIDKYNNKIYFYR